MNFNVSQKKLKKLKKNGDLRESVDELTGLVPIAKSWRFWGMIRKL